MGSRAIEMGLGRMTLAAPESPLKVPPSYFARLSMGGAWGLSRLPFSGFRVSGSSKINPKSAGT
jgi:hypothetical protein